MSDISRELIFAFIAFLSVMTKPNLAIWKRKSDKNDENAIELTKSKRQMVFTSIVNQMNVDFGIKIKILGINFRGH